jgi:hypothetical protein
MHHFQRSGLAAIAPQEVVANIRETWREYDQMLLRILSTHTPTQAQIDAGDVPPTIVVWDIDETSLFHRYDSSERVVSVRQPNGKRVKHPGKRGKTKNRAAFTLLAGVCSDARFQFPSMIIMKAGYPRKAIWDEVQTATQQQTAPPCVGHAEIVAVRGNKNGRAWIDQQLFMTHLLKAGQYFKRRARQLGLQNVWLVLTYDHPPVHRTPDEFAERMESNYSVLLFPKKPHVSVAIQAPDVMGLWRTLKTTARDFSTRHEFYTAQPSFWSWVRHHLRQYCGPQLVEKLGYWISRNGQYRTDLQSELRNLIETYGN